jgi:predicted nucleic acid-binding protein
LICLDKIGRVYLPAGLATVSIPTAVMTEIGQGPTPVDLARLGAYRIVEVGTIHPMVAAWDLGTGESEVLSLAAASSGAIAVIDDRSARRCADALGVSARGTLRVLLDAKRAGLVSEVAPLMSALRGAGLYVSDSLVARVLQLAGEAG